MNFLNLLISNLFTYPVNSSMDPLLHWPRCGPCIILAGRLDAPSGSECDTSSINSTDGPPKLVLRFDSRLGPCRWLYDVSPLLDDASPFNSLFSESDTASGPCAELELSLRKRPMIDFGCFGFSIPPNGVVGVCKMEEGERENSNQIVGKISFSNYG